MRIPAGRAYDEIRVGDEFDYVLTITEAHLVTAAAFSETSTRCIWTKRLQANPDSVDAFCTDHLPAPLLQRPLESIFQVPRSPILSTFVDFWLRLNLAIR